MNRIKIMQRLFMLTVSFLLQATVAHADTVSVAGVVLSKDSESRLGTVKVQLVVDKKSGGMITDDSTSREGVYILSCTSVSAGVTDLWVICADTDYNTRPIAAILEARRQGVRRSKTRDMEAASSTQPLRDIRDIAWHLVAVQETEAVKVRLGLTSPEDAAKSVSQKLASILKRASIKKDETDKVDRLIREMGRQFRQDIVKTPFLTKEDVLKSLDELERRSRQRQPR